MTWNYRIFKQATPKSVESKYTYFIGECYYRPDGTAKFNTTIDTNNLIGSDIAEIESTYRMMREAFTAPAVELDAEGNIV